MTSEEKSQYYEELALQLRNLGVQIASIDEDGLWTSWQGKVLCKVSETGRVLYHPRDVRGPARENICIKVNNMALATAEYMALMETAPPLKATSLDGDYRILAEFNGVVLAGHPTQYGVQFVTWEWVQNHTSLWQGHYYGDNYAAAKRDFATRSGLLPPEQLFSDEQLTEIYRSVHETLESDYPMTKERERLLTDTVAQIERAVPSLEELVQKSNEEELQQGLAIDNPGMTQQF